MCRLGRVQQEQRAPRPGRSWSHDELQAQRGRSARRVQRGRLADCQLLRTGYLAQSEPRVRTSAGAVAAKLRHARQWAARRAGRR